MSETAPPVADGGHVLKPTYMAPLTINVLPLGRKFHYALRDQQGEQLLDAGVPITPRFLETLRSQNISTVWLHQDDAKDLLVEGAHGVPLSWQVPPRLSAQTPETQRLDRELAKPHSMEIVVSGPPFRDRFDRHGAEPHDIALVNRVLKQRDASISQLKNLLEGMKSIQEAQRTKVGTYGEIVQTYMGLMQADLDLVVSTTTMPRDREYLPRHALELSILSMAVAADMGFDDRNVLLVGMTGILHDVGMLMVPEDIRDAPRRISPNEYAQVMKHVIYSVDILAKITGVPNVVRMSAYQVHERHNGKGYPRGRKGDQIHPFARVLAVSDTYLALISPRPYQPAALPYAAMETMLHQTKEGFFDPVILRSLLNVLSLFPLGSYVIMSDGRAGRVIRTHPREYDRPVVEITCDIDGNPVPGGLTIDLAARRDTKVVQAIGAPAEDPRLAHRAAAKA